MNRSSAHTRLVVIVAVAVTLGAVATAAAAGCGSSNAEAMPTFSATAKPGPKAHEVTVHITSGGSGKASAAVVFTYPDGRRDWVESGTWSTMESSTYTKSDLRAGVYTFTVYAIPANSQDSAPISVGYFTDDHKAASAKVTIP
jgi:hypothetical protein